MAFDIKAEIAQWLLQKAKEYPDGLPEGFDVNAVLMAWLLRRAKAYVDGPPGTTIDDRWLLPNTVDEEYFGPPSCDWVLIPRQAFVRLNDGAITICPEMDFRYEYLSCDPRLPDDYDFAASLRLYVDTIGRN